MTITVEMSLISTYMSSENIKSCIVYAMAIFFLYN